MSLSTMWHGLQCTLGHYMYVAKLQRLLQWFYATWWAQCNCCSVHCHDFGKPVSVCLLPQWRSPNLKVGLPVWWSNTGKTDSLVHISGTATPERLFLVYFQVVQLPKETYATDIHWFPPGVSSKKTSNQSDLFVLACTDGQSAVVRVMWLVWEIIWLVWEVMWLVWEIMWLVLEIIWLAWGHVTCMRGHVTCMRDHVTCMISHVTCMRGNVPRLHDYFCLQESHITIVARFLHNVLAQFQ